MNGAWMLTSREVGRLKKVVTLEAEFLVATCFKKGYIALYS